MAIPVERLRSGPFRREQAFRGNIPLEAFLVSTGVVALGEIGDKTQLLALMLAALGVYTLLAFSIAA